MIERNLLKTQQIEYKMNLSGFRVPNVIKKLVLFSVILSHTACVPIELSENEFEDIIKPKRSPVTPPEIVSGCIHPFSGLITTLFSLKVGFYAKIWLFGVKFINIGSALS